MEIVRTVNELRQHLEPVRASGRVGLVPTMGAFHEGHLSLMRRARSECAAVVVSLFVNPAQFGPHEDLERYPRNLPADCAFAENEGVDLLFAPPVDEVYPPGFRTYVDVEGLTERLCGAERPGHFRGVATVVTKLFCMALPDRSYFGEKDYQQLQVIRRLARDLNLPGEIVSCPIVREPDELAMSSRNRYLTPAERVTARAVPRAWQAARARFAAGERATEALRDAARRVLEAEPGIRVNYVELVDAADLTPIARVTAPALLALAVTVGKTRLIDNTVLCPEQAEAVPEERST